MACLLDGLESALPKTLDLSNMPEITEQKLCEALSENPGTECLQLAGAIDAKMLICVEKFVGATLVEFSLAGCTVSDNDLEVLNDLLSSSFPVLNVVNVRGNDAFSAKHLASIVVRRRMNGMSLIRICTA